MKNYREPQEETRKIIEEVFSKTDLDRIIFLDILCDDNQKDLFRLYKTNEITRYLTKKDLIIVVNEKAFDMLPEDIKLLKCEEVFSSVYWDFEKSVLKINKGDVNTFSLFLKKYGYDTFERMEESIKSVFDTLKNKEE
jgi:nitrogen regulatory protein PII